MKDDEDLDLIWDLIPDETDIVITHGPAYGAGDLVTNHMYDRDHHVGSVSLKTKLLKLPNLKLHVCGHIHEASGIYIGDYVTVNASTCDLSYIPFNIPISVNISWLHRLDYIPGSTIVPEGSFTISPSSLGKFFDEPHTWHREHVLGQRNFGMSTATILGTIVHFCGEEFIKTKSVDKLGIYRYI